MYIIKADIDTRFYSPEGADDMHRTSCGNDIPSLPAWIKKFDLSKQVEFFGRGRRIRPTAVGAVARKSLSPTAFLTRALRILRISKQENETATLRLRFRFLGISGQFRYRFVKVKTTGQTNPLAMIGIVIIRGLPESQFHACNEAYV